MKEGNVRLGSQDTQEAIDMSQPPGFEGGTQQVWRLRKAIYGLKQGAWAWQLQLADHLTSMGYTTLKADPGVFVHEKKIKIFYTHVDDLIHFAQRGQGEENILEVFKRFPCKFFGAAKRVLGMRIQRDREAKTISISQPHLVEGILARFGQEGSVPRACPLRVKLPSDTQLPPLHDGQVAEYPAFVGTLLYLANVSRPDLCFTASALARYTSAPTKELDQAAVNLTIMQGRQLRI
jgi:hypothetical protein